MSKADKDKLGLKMEKLAEKLADDLSAGKDPSKLVVDGFGKLTSYFAATRRLNLKTPDPDEQGETFATFRDKITGTDAQTN